MPSCLCAPGAGRAEHRGAGGPGHSAPDAGRGRRSARAPARAVPAPRRRQGDPPAPPRGGAGSARPRPAGPAVEGGARPGTSAREQRSRHHGGPRRRPPHNGPALRAARRSPAARPPRESALTSGQRGAVVDGDPDLLHSALSQLQGHLHSLDSAAVRPPPPRRIQTWGGEQPVDPRNKGEEGVRARERGAGALPCAAFWKRALC